MREPDPSFARIDGRWKHRDVYANGIRLHIAEAGSGPLVVLLHGFGEFWWAWRHLLCALPDAGFHTVAADLRGYGDSDKPPRGYDVWTLAGDVTGLVRALGERRAHLVGHAWGGMLAWSTAALHPRIVDSVCVLGSAHPLALRRATARSLLRASGQARALGHLFRFQLPMLPERSLVREDAAELERLLRAWSGPSWQASEDFDEVARTLRTAIQIPGVAHSALEYYRWAFRAQFRGEGRRLREAVGSPVEARVLRLHGDQDPCVLPETARKSTRWAGPRSALQLMPDVGHFPHLEAPADTTKAIADFLRA